MESTRWINDMATATSVFLTIAAAQTAVIIGLTVLWLRLRRRTDGTVKELVTVDDLRREVLGSRQTAVVYFWADWWRPSMKIRTHLRTIADNNRHVRFFEVSMELDERPEVIKALPEMMNPPAKPHFRPHFAIVKGKKVRAICTDLDDAQEVDAFLAKWM